MQPEHISLAFLTGIALLGAYGLWPAIWPGHFREVCIRYFRPRSVAGRVGLSAPTIRAIAIAWIALASFVLLLGLSSLLN